jgi:hypothetical protein
MPRKPLEVSPKAEHKEEPPRRNPGEKKQRVGWCKFEAKRRCLIEGILLEGPEQTIELSPRASWNVRENKNIKLLSGDIPECPENVNILDFIEDLEDGDPKVGAAPVDLKLIKQG